MRGGYSAVGHSYAEANHPDVPNFRPGDPETTVLEVDCGNQYGWAMSQVIDQEIIVSFKKMTNFCSHYQLVNLLG